MTLTDILNVVSKKILIKRGLYTNSMISCIFFASFFIFKNDFPNIITFIKAFTHKDNIKTTYG